MSEKRDQQMDDINVDNFASHLLGVHAFLTEFPKRFRGEIVRDIAIAVNEVFLKWARFTNYSSDRIEQLETFSKPMSEGGLAREKDQA